MKRNDKYRLVEDYIIKNSQMYYRTAYSYVKNQEDALDIVQESILKALKSIDKLEQEAYIKTWFYKILINTALDFLKKQKNTYLADDRVLSFMSEGKNDVYEDFDLQRALDELPEVNRTIIILRYFEDMKLEEIAEIVGENISTVKTRLYAGLKKLRVELEDQNEEVSYGKVKNA